MKINGIEGMTVSQVQSEVARGGKFVMYQYCISILIMTFRRSSGIYFIKADENAITPGLGFTLLSLVLGWWGIPWGPIYTIGSIYTNFTGGKDVTQEMMASVARPAQPVTP
jgi:hypothetical protein